MSEDIARYAGIGGLLQMARDARSDKAESWKLRLSVEGSTVKVETEIGDEVLSTSKLMGESYELAIARECLRCIKDRAGAAERDAARAEVAAVQKRREATDLRAQCDRINAVVAALGGEQKGDG